MRRFEYMQRSLAEFHDTVVMELNRLGLEGWELCATINGPPLYLYFKRERIQ